MSTYPDTAALIAEVRADLATETAARRAERPVAPRKVVKMTETPLPSPQTRRAPADGFGATLAELRKIRRLSQSALADRARYDHSYISRLESGDRLPTRDAVTTLVQVLNVGTADANRLYFAAGYVPGGMPIPDDLVPWLEAGQRLTPEQRAAVLTLAGVGR